MNGRPAGGGFTVSHPRRQRPQPRSGRAKVRHCAAIVGPTDDYWETSRSKQTAFELVGPYFTSTVVSLMGPSQVLSGTRIQNQSSGALRVFG